MSHGRRAPAKADARHPENRGIAEPELPLFADLYGGLCTNLPGRRFCDGLPETGGAAWLRRLYMVPVATSLNHTNET